MPEVLVATVIAAGVLTTTMSAIGGLVRLDAATTRHADALSDAETIAARLRIGMNDSDTLEGFKAWRLERRPLEIDAEKVEPAFDRVMVRNDGGGVQFEILAPRKDQQ